MKSFGIVYKVGAALLVGVALLLTACPSPATPTPTPTPAAATPTPTPPAGVTPTPGPTPPPPAIVKPTGELRIAMSYLGVEVLDPILSLTSGKTYLGLVYDNLIKATPQGELAPEKGIATRWEVSPDKKTWTLTLRKGARFHNGDEVTSEDVKFSLERFMSPKSVSTNATTFRALIERVEAPNPTTVVVQTKKPYGLLDLWLSNLIANEGMVMPKKYIQEKGDDYFATHPIGTAPYRFVEQVVGSYVTFEAVENHWSGVVPKFKRIIFFLVPEETTRIAMLKTGQADIIDTSREKLKEITGAGMKVFGKERNTLVGMWLDKQWDPATYLSDKRVREALNLATNREEILKFIYEGQGGISYTHNYGSLNIGYEPVAPYPYDPDRAKKLIAEAFPGGVTLDLYSFPRPGVGELPRMNEAIAGAWEKIGVKSKIIPVEYGTYRTRKSRGELANTAAGMSVANWPFPGGTIRTIYHSKGLLTVAKDPKLDILIDAVTDAIDLEQLGAAHRAVGKYIRENHLSVGIVEVGWTFATSPKKVPSWELGKIEYDMNLVEGFK